MANDQLPYITKLVNGVNMPVLGLGTFGITDSRAMEMVLGEAFKLGFRHIDTAAFYQNESVIRGALKVADIPRDQVFITTKVWVDDNGYDTTLKAFERSLNNLGTDYLDLYLIHWPSEATLETWMALERLYAEGKVRAIGVSNFSQEDLNILVESNHMKPMINQIEVHPGYPQEELIRYCRRHQIVVSAATPLARGEFLDHPVIREIAQAHQKTTAQIILRWHLQRDVCPLPKTEHPNRLQENMDVFDFQLDQGQMNNITSLGGKQIYSYPV
ncbi:MAG: aldo/keto reductase [Spirochaetota bacterium]